jgi:hypothetical protein
MANNQQLLLGEGAGGGIPNYIEDVFSTYLYTGTGAALTITNNIDLSTKGGLVWIKDRDSGAKGHGLFDTVRGVNRKLQSQSTNPEFVGANQLTAFNATGFDLGTTTDQNGSGTTYVSWTFREQKKFFDVVTYTGNGSNQTISHSLGAAPGCIIVKCTSDGTTNWFIYHSSLAVTSGRPGFLYLDSTSAVQTGDPTVWPSVPTSTTFEVGSYNALNGSGRTYVAYLFAHDAGGFGLSGTDNVISCGSFTTDGSSNFSASLGYEPQWVMIKRYNTTGNWLMFDNMRGMGVQGISNVLYADVANAEAGPNSFMAVNSTGFSGTIGSASDSFIYIAIRRGPMKVPTVGTSVYNAIRRSGTGAVANVTGVGFTPDQTIVSGNVTSGGGYQTIWVDRLRGSSQYIRSALTNAEVTDAVVTSLDMDGVTLVGTGASLVNASGSTYINWFFKRAPGFFDEVCYTGTGTAGQTFSHNLATVPELMIVKCRSNASSSWRVLYQPTGIVGQLESTATVVTTNREFYFGDDTNYISPTSSVFTVASNSSVNTSARTYVAYLFATCAGVSKVGSYTGTAAAQVINCGFTAGARFVLIKKTSGTGSWYVWDSARGIVAGNDPYLLLNSTAAEVTSTDYVDTASVGFEISSTAPSEINENGGSFIFLAIA